MCLCVQEPALPVEPRSPLLPTLEPPFPLALPSFSPRPDTKALAQGRMGFSFLVSTFGKFSEFDQKEGYKPSKHFLGVRDLPLAFLTPLCVFQSRVGGTKRWGHVRCSPVFRHHRCLSVWADQDHCLSSSLFLPRHAF